MHSCKESRAVIWSEDATCLCQGEGPRDPMKSWRKSPESLTLYSQDGGRAVQLPPSMPEEASTAGSIGQSYLCRVSRKSNDCHHGSPSIICRVINKPEPPRTHTRLVTGSSPSHSLLLPTPCGWSPSYKQSHRPHPWLIPLHLARKCGTDVSRLMSLVLPPWQ